MFSQIYVWAPLVLSYFIAIKRNIKYLLWNGPEFNKMIQNCSYYQKKSFELPICQDHEFFIPYANLLHVLKGQGALQNASHQTIISDLVVLATLPESQDNLYCQCSLCNGYHWLKAFDCLSFMKHKLHNCLETLALATKALLDLKKASIYWINLKRF